MKIELRKTASIIPYARNPRVNDGAVDAVAASIREFGFRSPIVVDKKGVIICGHTRYKAAQKLGLAKVPVHVATELTDRFQRYTGTPAVLKRTGKSPIPMKPREKDMR